MADQHKIVTDRLNTFFTNNKIQIATSAPTSGSYIVGDIVIKSNQKAGTNVGWICTVAGAPGTWVEFGVGADHSHNYAGSSSAGGAANSVKTNLAIKLNSGTTEGTNLFTFNGSTAKTINITPSSIGAAETNHTHDYALSSSVGTLSSLETTDKSNLVAAINEVFQSGNNAKQKLVDALVAKGQSCSTSDNWDTLIGKIGNINTEPHVIFEAGFKNGYSMINYSTYAASGVLGINLRTGTTSRAVYTSIGQLIDFSKYKKLSILIYKNDATGSANYWYIATGSSAVSGLARDDDDVKQCIGTIISETTVNYNTSNDCHVINVDLTDVNTTSYLQIARVSPVSEERTATVIRLALS